MTDTARNPQSTHASIARSLIVRERSNRWWVVYATTPLMPLGPEVANQRDALETARALYPGFNVEPE